SEAVTISVVGTVSALPSGPRPQMPSSPYPPRPLPIRRLHVKSLPFFRNSLVAAMAALVFALPALAQQTDAAALRQAEAEGYRLWQLDSAIQAARRSALARRDFRKDERVQGWIHEFDGDDIVVTFIRERKGESVPRYRTRIAANGTASSTEELDDELPVEGTAAAWLRAQFTAQQVPSMTCSKVIEDIVMPAGNGLRVYRVQRASFDDVLLAGGAQRIEISPDGGRVLGYRDLTGDCTTLKKDASSSSVGIIEAVDPQPNEFHV